MGHHITVPVINCKTIHRAELTVPVCSCLSPYKLHSCCISFYSFASSNIRSVSLQPGRFSTVTQIIPPSTFTTWGKVPVAIMGEGGGTTFLLCSGRGTWDFIFSLRFCAQWQKGTGTILEAHCLTMLLLLHHVINFYFITLSHYCHFKCMYTECSLSHYKNQWPQRRQGKSDVEIH